MPKKYMGHGTLESLELAIDIMGGRSPLAEAIGVSRQTIDNWLRQHQPPAERVLTLEKLTLINKSDFRPDIYPPPKRRN